MPVNAFRALWDLGYRRLLCVVPPDAPLRDAGKRPGIRKSDGWFGIGVKNFDATEDDLDRWHDMGGGVGIRCDGTFCAIDVDSLSREWSPKIVALAREMLGPAPIRFGREPKALLVYKAAEPMGYLHTRFDDGVDPKKPGVVEFLSGAEDTKWFVAYGVHPVTKKPYRWPEGLPHADTLTTVTKEQITAFFDRLDAELPKAKSSRLKERQRGSVANGRLATKKPDVLARAVRSIRNDPAEFGGYPKWYEMSVALRGAFPDDQALALELFEDFTERGEIDEPTERPDRVFWSSHPPFDLGEDYLVALVQKHGDPTLLAPLHFDDLGEPEPVNEASALFAEADLNALKNERAEQSASKFTLIPFEDAARLATEDVAPPLIKGLLDQGTLSCLYGDSNVGKTFVAMDMAYHVSAGRSYSGLKTERGLVVYVAAEGGRGAKRRLAALRQKFGPTDRPDFVLLPASVDLRNPEIDLNAFKAALASLGRPVVLIVIDTLSRAMAGGDENGSVDMGAFVRNVDAVRAATGAHVMIVHHTGKDKAKGARGHTLLRAALDTELEVAEGLISVTKQRDLDKSWTSAFRLEVRELGRDADGDRITSCTVRLDGVTAERRGEPTEGETAVRAAIEMLSETSHKPEDGARTSDLEAWCKANLDGMTRDALNAHLRGLRQKRLIDQPKRGYWRAIGHPQFDVLDGRECVETASTHSVLGQSVQSESVGMCEQCVGDIFS